MESFISDPRNQKIKQVIYLLIAFTISCTSSMDIKKANSVVQNLIESMKNENFNNFSEYYASNFFINISEKMWIDDIKLINQKLGPISSYKLIDSSININGDKENNIVLLFEMQHTKFKSQQIFTLIIENGKYKIYGHKIKSDAL